MSDDIWEVDLGPPATDEEVLEWLSRQEPTLVTEEAELAPTRPDIAEPLELLGEEVDDAALRQQLLQAGEAPHVRQQDLVQQEWEDAFTVYSPDPERARAELQLMRELGTAMGLDPQETRQLWPSIARAMGEDSDGDPRNFWQRVFVDAPEDGILKTHQGFIWDNVMKAGGGDEAFERALQQTQLIDLRLSYGRDETPGWWGPFINTMEVVGQMIPGLTQGVVTGAALTGGVAAIGGGAALAGAGPTLGIAPLAYGLTLITTFGFGVAQGNADAAMRSVRGHIYGDLRQLEVKVYRHPLTSEILSEAEARSQMDSVWGPEIMQSEEIYRIPHNVASAVANSVGIVSTLVDQIGLGKLVGEAGRKLVGRVGTQTVVKRAADGAFRALATRFLIDALKAGTFELGTEIVQESVEALSVDIMQNLLAVQAGLDESVLDEASWNTLRDTVASTIEKIGPASFILGLPGATATGVSTRMDVRALAEQQGITTQQAILLDRAQRQVEARTVVVERAMVERTQQIGQIEQTVESLEVEQETLEDQDEAIFESGDREDFIEMRRAEIEEELTIANEQLDTLREQQRADEVAQAQVAGQEAEVLTEEVMAAEREDLSIEETVEAIRDAGFSQESVSIYENYAANVRAAKNQDAVVLTTPDTDAEIHIFKGQEGWRLEVRDTIQNDRVIAAHIFPNQEQALQSASGLYTQQGIPIGDPTFHVELPQREAEAARVRAPKPKTLARQPGTIKQQIWQGTGMTRNGAFIAEDEALGAGIHKLAKLAPDIFKAGQDKILLAQQARQRRQDVVDNIKSLSRVIVDPKQKAAINKIHASFDLRKMSPKKRAKITPIANAIKEAAEIDGIEGTPGEIARARMGNDLPEVLIRDLERLDKTPVRDMMINDMETIRDAIAAQVQISKDNQVLRIGDRSLELVESIKTMRGEMKTLKEVDETTIQELEVALGDKAKDAVKHAWTLGFGFYQEHWDLTVLRIAGPDSLFYEALVTEVDKGRTEWNEDRQDFFALAKNGIVPLLKRLPSNRRGKFAQWLNEKATWKFKGFSMTRAQRIEFYMHSQNVKNRLAMIEGGILPTNIRAKKGFEAPKPTPLTEQEIQDVVDEMPEAEKAIGESLRPMFDESYRRVNETHMSVTGFELAREELYYPSHRARTDVSFDEAVNDYDSQIEKWKTSSNNPIARISVPDSITKTKTRNTRGLYINGVMDTVNQYIESAATYNAFALRMKEIHTILFNTRDLIVGRFGKEYFNQIALGLVDVIGESYPMNAGAKLLRGLRRHLSVATIGLNPKIALTQAFSFPLFNIYVPARDLMAGTAKMLMHPVKSVRGLSTWSPNFVDRVSNASMSRDLAELLREDAAMRKLLGKTRFREVAMIGTRFIDSSTVTAGMLGAQNFALREFKAIQKGKKTDLNVDIQTATRLSVEDVKSLNADQMMRLATNFGDWVVSQTQPMFSPEHRTALSRGRGFLGTEGSVSEATKSFTQFMSYQSQALAVIRRSLVNLEFAKNRADPKTIRKRQAQVFKAYTHTILLAGMMAMAFDWMWRWVVRGKKEPPRPLLWLTDVVTGRFALVREFTRPLVTNIERGPGRGYDVNIPTTSIISRVVRGVAALARLFGADGKQSPASRRRDQQVVFDDLIGAGLEAGGVPGSAPIRRGITRLTR